MTELIPIAVSISGSFVAWLMADARSKAKISFLEKQIDRIDASKASKDVVDGLRTEIATLRTDMEKRFDKLERMLESLGGR